MFRLIAFIVLSACLTYLSRASLRVPRSHGFYRFLAAEFILALVLLNLDHWFQQPFAPHQIASWLLLAVSIALVVHGAYLLKVVGRPGSRPSDGAPLASIEKTACTALGVLRRNELIKRHNSVRYTYYGLSDLGAEALRTASPEMSQLGVSSPLAVRLKLVHLRAR